LTVSEERARMSREMHDSLGHYLAVINVGLQIAQRFREKRPESAWAEVEEARDLTREALSEVRRWVRVLKPLALEDRASPEAMVALARSFEGTDRVVRRLSEELPRVAAIVLTTFDDDEYVFGV
jgi:signal transduction histidine kinase